MSHPGPLPPPPDLEERHVRAGGVDLFVRSWGEGPPLLLVHGGPGGSGSYWPVTVPSLGERLRVHAVDLRGHGRSARTPPYSIATFARDLSALREALGLGRAALLGHSYGATVALEAALADASFDRLVLVGGFARTWRVVAQRRGLAAKARMAARVVSWNARERLGRRPPLRPYLRSLLEGARPLLHGPGAPAWHDEVLFASVTDPLDPVVPLQYDLVAWSAWDRLPALAAPTLLLYGSHDALAAPMAERLARRVPDARVRCVEGAGHSPFLDAPDVFRTEVESFVRAT